MKDNLMETCHDGLTVFTCNRSGWIDIKKKYFIRVRSTNNNFCHWFEIVPPNGKSNVRSRNYSKKIHCVNSAKRFGKEFGLEVRI